MGCMGLRVISQTFDQMGHLHPCFLLHFSFSLTTVFFFFITTTTEESIL